MVIYPYPFLVVNFFLLSSIIFINDCICLLNDSNRSLCFMIVFVIWKMGGNNNSSNYFNVMVNYHYHGENRVVT